VLLLFLFLSFFLFSRIRLITRLRQLVLILLFTAIHPAYEMMQLYHTDAI